MPTEPLIRFPLSNVGDIEPERAAARCNFPDRSTRSVRPDIDYRYPVEDNRRTWHGESHCASVSARRAWFYFYRRNAGGGSQCDLWSKKSSGSPFARMTILYIYTGSFSFLRIARRPRIYTRASVPFCLLGSLRARASATRKIRVPLSAAR